MKKSLKRKLMFCISLSIVLSIIISAYTPVMALNNYSEHYVTVSKNKSFKNDNGNFYMSFNLNNVSNLSEAYKTDLYIEAKVLSSSGQTMAKWKPFYIKSGINHKQNFGCNYGPFPTGNYTFVLTATTVKNNIDYTWNYKIKHTCTSAISFKSFDKIIDSKGVERNKFSIQCTDIKGKQLIIKIIDSNGNAVYEQTGPARMTNNEVGWFAWDGYSNVGSNYKCKSGQYVVEVHYSGGSKIIQNIYNLII
ncbi:MAG: hypothetical protein ACERLG_05290 [Sedimentibacter sp.]